MNSYEFLNNSVRGFRMRRKTKRYFRQTFRIFDLRERKSNLPHLPKPKWGILLRERKKIHITHHMMLTEWDTLLLWKIELFPQIPQQLGIFFLDCSECPSAS